MKKLLFAIFSLFVSLHLSSQVIWSDDFSNATNWSISIDGVQTQRDGSFPVIHQFCQLTAP